MNSPPRSEHKFTYREYQYFPDDGKRHEIIDGDHYMSPAPSTKHQTVSRRLQFQLYRQIEEPKRGWVFNAPTDVELTVHDIVQPDLIVVLQARREIIIRSRIQGIPNLVVEILSESNPAHGRVLKFELYQRVGIEEFWIVDPEVETLEQWLSDHGTYRAWVKTKEKVECQSIPGVTVELASIWNL